MAASGEDSLGLEPVLLGKTVRGTAALRGWDAVQLGEDRLWSVDAGTPITESERAVPTCKGGHTGTSGENMASLNHGMMPLMAVFILVLSCPQDTNWKGISIFHGTNWS